MSLECISIVQDLQYCSLHIFFPEHSWAGFIPYKEIHFLNLFDKFEMRDLKDLDLANCPSTCAVGQNASIGSKFCLVNQHQLCLILFFFLLLYHHFLYIF